MVGETLPYLDLSLESKPSFGPIRCSHRTLHPLPDLRTEGRNPERVGYAVLGYTQEGGVVGALEKECADRAEIGPKSLHLRVVQSRKPHH